MATPEQINKKWQELEDWRAARICHLVMQYNAGLITKVEFLNDVRQAMQ